MNFSVNTVHFGEFMLFGGKFLWENKETILHSFRSLRVLKGVFVTRGRPFLFPVKCEIAIFFLVNRDFHSRREP